MGTRGFLAGEVVDVTIKGVRVVGTNALTGAPTIVDEDGREFPMPPQAAVVGVAPPDWPPRVGDLWRDRAGYLWLAQHAPAGESGVRMRCTTDEQTVPHELLTLGPLTRVHREESR